MVVINFQTDVARALFRLLRFLLPCDAMVQIAMPSSIMPATTSAFLRNLATVRRTQAQQLREGKREML